MRRITIILAITIYSLDVFACECIPILTLEQHFKKADVVFYATVTSINDREIPGYKDTMHFLMDSSYADSAGYHTTLMINKIYKGNIYSAEVNIQSNWSLCDILFRINNNYIVFGYYDEHGRIRTSTCTPTSVVTDNNLLEQIEKIK